MVIGEAVSTAPRRPGRPRKPASLPGQEKKSAVWSTALEDWQSQALLGHAEASGLSKSEVLRAAVGEYLDARGL